MQNNASTCLRVRNIPSTWGVRAIRDGAGGRVRSDLAWHNKGLICRDDILVRKHLACIMLLAMNWNLHVLDALNDLW